MKLVVLLASSALVLTSCGPDAGPSNQSAEPVVTQNEAGSFKSTKAFAVEPITAVSAGLSIASSLKNLFSNSSGERDLKKIRKQLGEIAAQNRQILQTLGEIVAILNNLGVIVRENVRYEAIFGKQATLSSEAEQVFETWIAELDDPRARRQAEARYRNDILPDVRDVTHELTNEGYGYTAFDSVGHGMLLELWMSRRIGERSSLRRQAAATYLAYFDRALTPTLAGSPAHALAQAEAQRNRMKVILDAADARLGANGWSVSRDYERNRSSGRRTTYTTYRETRTASGNQRDGYTYSVTTTVVRERVEVEPSDVGPRCGMCSNLENAMKAEATAKSAKSLGPDPTDPNVDTPEARVNYWNAARATYLQAAKEAEVLAKSNETLRIYRSEAQLAQRER